MKQANILADELEEEQQSLQNLEQLSNYITLLLTFSQSFHHIAGLQLQVSSIKQSIQDLVWSLNIQLYP